MIEPVWIILALIVLLDLLISSTRVSLLNARLHLLVDIQQQKPTAEKTDRKSVV